MSKTIENLQKQKKITRHWLHCVLMLVTLGFWLPFYVIIVSFRAIHNHDVQSKIEGAALAMGEHEQYRMQYDAVQRPISMGARISAEELARYEAKWQAVDRGAVSPKPAQDDDQLWLLNQERN